eukprot:Hpha_TRINITY_DN15393_c1_g6::TRINITY_DN15393_c1_g6_i1::g.87350::m.87350
MTDLKLNEEVGLLKSPLGTDDAPHLTITPGSPPPPKGMVEKMGKEAEAKEAGVSGSPTREDTMASGPFPFGSFSDHSGQPRPTNTTDDRKVRFEGEPREKRKSLFLEVVSGRRRSQNPLAGRRTSAVCGPLESWPSLTPTSEFPQAELTAEEEEAFLSLFGQLDSTMDGTIPTSELVGACRLLQMTLSRNDIEEQFSLMDNGDHRVNPTEFLQFMRWAKARGALRFNKERLQWVVSKVLSERLLNDPAQKDRKHALKTASDKKTELRWLVEGIVFVATVYYGLLVPIHFAVLDLDDFSMYGPGVIVLECACTLVFILDVSGALRRRNNSREAQLQLRGKRSSVLRIHSWSQAFDVACAIPLDLVGVAVRSKYVYGLGLMMRLGCLSKIPQLFLVGNMTLMTTRTVTWAYEVAPALRLFSWTIMVCNFLACLFLSVQSCSDDNGGCPSLWDKYLESIYWSMYTISSVGYGDVEVSTRGAKILAIFMFMMSILVNGFFVGKISSLIAVDPQGEHRETMAKTRQILSELHLPPDLREDILSLQNHLLEMKVTMMSFRSVISLLPSAVQEGLALYMRVYQLMQVPLFQNVSAPCQVAVAEVLHTNIFARDEHLTLRGDGAQDMYFLTHGYAEVISDSERVAVLGPGAFFGELPLVGKSIVHASTVRSLTYTEVLVLNQRDFLEITGRFPTLRYHVQAHIALQRGEPAPPFAFDEFQKNEITDLNTAIQQRLKRRRLSRLGQYVAGDSHDDPELLGLSTDSVGPPVRFYGFAGEWGQLCSFWPSEFEVRGHQYPSLEHFFQAMKFEGTFHADQVRRAPTPEDARARGKDRTRPIRPDWDAVKDSIMLEGLRNKFSQDLDCQAVLTGTGSRKLLFSDSNDDYWGIGPGGMGKNKLGMLLMSVREELEMDAIRFYGYTGEWGRLSNFFPCQITVDGLKYPTVEHFYQSTKWRDTPRMKEIMEAGTPEMANLIGNERRAGEYPADTWDEEREMVMLKGLRAKFIENIACRDELLRTGCCRIVFESPQDRFWGMGEGSVGANMLGLALETVREELLSEKELNSMECDSTPSPRSRQAGSTPNSGLFAAPLFPKSVSGTELGAATPPLPVPGIGSAFPRNTSSQGRGANSSWSQRPPFSMTGSGGPVGDNLMGTREETWRTDSDLPSADMPPLNPTTPSHKQGSRTPPEVDRTMSNPYSVSSGSRGRRSLPARSADVPDPLPRSADIPEPLYPTLPGLHHHEEGGRPYTANRSVQDSNHTMPNEEGRTQACNTAPLRRSLCSSMSSTSDAGSVASMPRLKMAGKTRTDTGERWQSEGWQQQGGIVGTEVMDLLAQLRDTQLQQQEFIGSAVHTLLANQRVLGKRIRQLQQSSDPYSCSPSSVSGFGSSRANASSYSLANVAGRQRTHLHGSRLPREDTTQTIFTSQPLDEIDAEFPFTKAMTKYS